MEEHAGSSNITWYDCSRRLRSEGYNHTQGNTFAKIVGKGMIFACILRHPDGAHTVEYGKKVTPY